MTLYTTIAPSGVHVQSTVPFVAPRWWDDPRVHWLWSYLSWGTMILAARGHKGPRKMFRKYLTR